MTLLVVNSHEPRPSSGTSATANCLVNCPEMAPVEVTMLAADTTGFAVEFFTLKELALGGTVVTIDDTGRRVVAGVVDVVVDRGAAGIVVAGGVTRSVGAALSPEVGVVDVVRVNTSTRSNSGLDHIRMRVPFIELSVDAIRVEG